MSLDADRMSPRGRAGSNVALVTAIFLCGAWSASVALGEDEPIRGASQQSTGGMRLPPRQGSDATPNTRKNSSSESGLWTTVISLGVIVIVLGGVGYWLRPYFGVPRGLPIDALEILGRRVIEQKVAIHLVRCGSRVLIVSVSPDGARTLSEITDPAEVQRLVDACHSPRTTRQVSASIPLTGDSGGPHFSGGPQIKGHERSERSAVANSSLRGAVPRAAFQPGDTP